MELIKIYQGSLVNARELHKFLESKQDFSDWIKNRIKKYGFEEGSDFSINLWKSTGGRPSKEYVLTLNMAKELAMVENNAKGKQARRYFIEAEKTLAQLKENKRLDYWNKLQDGKSKLLNYILEKGHTEENFIQIDYEGRKILFNGEPLPDENLPKILLTARSFAVELSNEILEKQENSALNEIEDAHKMNHADVRKVIKQNTGKLPEQYSPESDIKKLGK